jgi:hypothetical protein
MAAAAAGGTERPAGAPRLEESIQIHRDVGGHGAENMAAADGAGGLVPAHQIHLLDRRQATGIASEDQARALILDILRTQMRIADRVRGRRIGLNGELRHRLAGLAVEIARGIEAGDVSRQRTAKTQGHPFRIHLDGRFAAV